MSSDRASPEASPITVLSVAKDRSSHVEGRLEMCACNPSMTTGSAREDELGDWTRFEAVSEGRMCLRMHSSVGMTGYMMTSTGSRHRPPA